MTRRILIVDDSASLLAAAGRVLRELGYMVTSTNSGADALCLLTSKPSPDLLVLDMVMPGMDGHEVIRKLGPTAPPVIVITGSEMQESDFAAGRVKRVLMKPFDKSALLQAVSDVFRMTPTILDDQSIADTKEEKPPPLIITEEQRLKAMERHERYEQANGGSHAPG